MGVGFGSSLGPCYFRIVDIVDLKRFTVLYTTFFVNKVEELHTSEEGSPTRIHKSDITASYKPKKNKIKNL